MGEFGFKNITSENWLEPDPVLKAFAKLTPQGIEQLTADDLLKDIFKPQLNDQVPQEVKALFEVVRGAMCYGYFFYPLYTLTSEQLFRVAETAVTIKCKDLSAPASVKSFAQKVDFLVVKSIIPVDEKLRWEGIRGLRNISSHPKQQSITPPGDAIHQLHLMSAIINKLFDSA